jgi:hypothetical protein
MLMRLESDIFLPALASCPDLVARQAASLMYYHAEVSYFALRPGYTPPRLLEGNSMMNTLNWWASGPAIMQACMDIRSDLMGYHYERDPAVLNSLQRRCADGLSCFGLEEVAGVMAAVKDVEKLMCPDALARFGLNEVADVMAAIKDIGKEL